MHTARSAVSCTSGDRAAARSCCCACRCHVHAAGVLSVCLLRGAAMFAVQVSCACYRLCCIYALQCRPALRAAHMPAACSMHADAARRCDAQGAGLLCVCGASWSGEKCWHGLCGICCQAVCWCWREDLLSRRDCVFCMSGSRSIRGRFWSVAVASTGAEVPCAIGWHIACQAQVQVLSL
jgi:hypothetical protein